ncbi:leucyl aminopeptidase family protein [Aliiglaciecola sp. M165]|uniref:leucyl aminopeptidase family protein n=1 Tax=Aliiglaciecola sp. M165 TaxID=2593649 RepID=UPI00117E3280|nr:leucyl aminopeptidase family protein [Aliiglaciecola sp. M165]TRY33237.1 leucyl aminopeptidase family protein [Aliiglaciecola sp. M165]
MRKLSIMIFALCTLSFSALAQVTVEFSGNVQGDVKHVVVLVDDLDTLNGAAAVLDAETNGQLFKALKAQSFKTEVGSAAILFGIGNYDRVVVLGSAVESPMNAVDLQNLGGKIAKQIGVDLKEQNIVVHVDGLNTEHADAAAHIAYGYELQNYRFEKYKSDKKQSPGTLTFISAGVNEAESTYNNDLKFLAEGIYMTRDLASEPGKTIYPQAFVDAVKKKFKGIKNIDIDVLTLRDMKKNNMGALMGVGQGSIHEPKMLVIEYKGADNDDAPIALAGKGITFDTGGISLKRNSGMWAMKSDMSGAAAVAGTLYAVASRKENVNLVGLMPLAENMPAEDAIRPGDVLPTMKGTSIEIISTDAEGRLILADAVYYAQQEFKPRMLVNIATLTGSAARALSDEYAVVITRDWDLSVDMMGVGERSGEAVWPLPLHPNHFEQIKSDIADIKNSGAGNPGASIGAAVIGTFVDEDMTWVHLDIAGVDWITDVTDTVPKGSSGWGVRFMDQLVRDKK